MVELTLSEVHPSGKGSDGGNIWVLQKKVPGMDPPSGNFMLELFGVLDQGISTRRAFSRVNNTLEDT